MIHFRTSTLTQLKTRHFYSINPEALSPFPSASLSPLKQHRLPIEPGRSERLCIERPDVAVQAVPPREDVERLPQLIHDLSFAVATPRRVVQLSATGLADEGL